MNLIIDGFAEGFIVTDGFGDSLDEPPPPDQAARGAVLGDDEGGLLADDLSPMLEGTD